MEALLIIGALALFIVFQLKPKRKASKPQTKSKPRSAARKTRAPRQPSTPPPRKTRTDEDVITGKAWVIDGDTIVINKTHIRLSGIDAPEMNHPYGRNSKSAMIALCKGQIITATIEAHESYDRIVATCTLPDGRDLSAELVKLGLAIDWPKFSGGKYKHLETTDARKKMWRADAKQRGRYNEAKHG